MLLFLYINKVSSLRRTISHSPWSFFVTHFLMVGGSCSCSSAACISTSLHERCTDWDMRLPGQSSCCKHCCKLHISSLSSASHKCAMVQGAPEDGVGHAVNGRCLYQCSTVKLLKAALSKGLHGLHWTVLLVASVTRFVLHQGRSNRMKLESYLMEKGNRGDWGNLWGRTKQKAYTRVFSVNICDHWWKREFRSRFEQWC